MASIARRAARTTRLSANLEIVVESDGGAARRGESDLQRVGERDGLEDGAQFVEAIGALAEDAQIEIDFGQRAHARAAGGAHLSYCSSEKTSWPASRCAAVEERQLDHEAEAHDHAAGLLHHSRGGGGGAAGGEQVVHDEDAMAVADGVLVHLQGVGAVLQIVGDADAFGGQLLRLAHRHEAGAERVGERRGEDEAAGFDAEDDIDLRIAVVVLQAVDDAAKSVRVLEQRGDVVEENAGLGEVGHLADE